MAGMAAVIGERAMTRRAGLDSRLRGNDVEGGRVYSSLEKPRPYLVEALDTYMKKLYFTIAYNTAPTATPCIEAHTNSGDGILRNLDIKSPHHVFEIPIRIVTHATG